MPNMELLKKLDKKHISPTTLDLFIKHRYQDAQGRPDVDFLRAQKRERLRQIGDALKNPEFYKRQQAAPLLSSNNPFMRPASGSFMPAAPGSPIMPGGPFGMSLNKQQSLQDFVMTKMAVDYVDVTTDDKRGAFKYGFFKKLAELGLLPSEVETLIKAAVGPADGAKTVAKAITRATLFDELAELMKGGVKGSLKTLWGAGKFMAGAPMLIAPLLGMILGGSAYYLSRPNEMQATDVHDMERLALYKRLAHRARSRAAMNEDEPLEGKHKMLAPSMGVEV